jgi:hypothetical protein
LQQTVCKGGFPMIDMRDNAKITDLLHEKVKTREGV